MIGTPANSYLGVPILVEGRAIGVISVQSITEAGRFGESDTRLLSTIAANVGAAIQNARLYRETQRRASEMAALAELGREIGGMLDLDAVIGRSPSERASSSRRTRAPCSSKRTTGSSSRSSSHGDSAELIMADTIIPGEGMIGDLAARGAAEVSQRRPNDRSARRDRSRVLRGDPRGAPDGRAAARPRPRHRR